MNVDSFSLRYAVVFLLILTQNCAIASVHNVASKPISLMKVVGNYLKVPWINLNSSWTDEVSSICRDDIAMLFRSADAGEMWAWRMLDSASKIPSGFLTGNIRDLGMYDECVRVKGPQNSANKIQGRHCMVSFSMPSKFVEDAKEILKVQKISIYNPTSDVDLSLTISTCLPSSCIDKDVSGFVNASIQSMPDLVAFEVAVARVTCSGVEPKDDLVLGTILVLSFFAAVTIILFLCTICDFVVRARPDVTATVVNTAAKFSLYTNAIKLASTKVSPETMPAIHGIRFLNTCLVVIAHRTLSVLIKPLVNLSHGYEYRQTWIAVLVHTVPYVVDSFFVLAGFLTAYLFLKALHAGEKFNVFVLYLHRYLRLTPVMAVLLVFNIFILPYLGSGPMWETVIGVAGGFCRKNWWANLLYIQNFVNGQEMCMLHTWYLAAEMQFFWVCPIILYPLFYRPKLGLAFVGLLSIAALIAPAAQLAVNQWAALFNVNKKMETIFYEFFNSYPITYNRALPYLIGILLGYDLVNNKRRITKVQIVFNWILAAIFILFSGWTTYFIQPNALAYDLVWEVIYVSVARLGWSLAMAWILYACTQGYGGAITRFLSLPMFVPLSRMCYSIYLVHFVIQVANNATERTAEFNSPFSVLYLVWGDLALSIAAALVLTLCFESPVIVLEKMLLVHRSPPIVEHVSTKKQRELSAIIKGYVDQTKDQVSSDSAIDPRMPQQVFWRKISKVLNTGLRKSSKKTPTDLAMAWQNWKSDLLRNETQRKISVKDVQNGSPQFQSEIPALEKELMIFFAGVTCGLDGAVSFKEPNSQLESLSWKNEDSVELSLPNSTPLARKRSKFSGSISASPEYPNRKNGILP